MASGGPGTSRGPRLGPFSAEDAATVGLRDRTSLHKGLVASRYVARIDPHGRPSIQKDPGREPFEVPLRELHPFEDSKQPSGKLEAQGRASPPWHRRLGGKVLRLSGLMAVLSRLGVGDSRENRTHDPSGPRGLTSLGPSRAGRGAPSASRTGLGARPYCMTK